MAYSDTLAAQTLTSLGRHASIHIGRDQLHIAQNRRQVRLPNFLALASLHLLLSSWREKRVASWSHTIPQLLTLTVAAARRRKARSVNVSTLPDHVNQRLRETFSKVPRRLKPCRSLVRSNTL